MGRAQGWDMIAISEIAERCYGGLEAMFIDHGWPERGNKMMPKQEMRMKEQYGSVENFVRQHETGNK